jgi:glycosyltransferase involved in cell wall biosynthesis
MNNLILGSLVYNEEHRFLDKFLNNMSQLTNKIIIIDDGSTDNSISICSKYTSNINITNRLMTKNESLLRHKLWNECTKIAKDGDYILIQDCDEFYTDNSLKNFEKELKTAELLNADSLAIKKYDMWNKTQYREDPPYWNIHFHFLVWCIKYRKNYNYYWNNRKLHCGSLPLNAYYCAFPSKLQVQHMAYSTLELRQQKVEFYKNLDPNAEWGIKEQYDSILDENPTLINFKDNFEDAE